MRLFEDGFMYASTGADSHSCRHSASLMLALTEAPIEVEAEGRVLRDHAIALRPTLDKQVRACGAPFVCLDASTGHPQYRALASLKDPGCVALPRAHFTAALPALDAYSRGLMSGRATRLLYGRVFDLLKPLLPEPAPLDERVTRVMALLDDDPTLGVAQLASAVCVSRDRLSHLFTQEMGLPLRKYAQSLKIRAAARQFGRGLSLTEIAAAAGFSDSAHFSKTWAQSYGASPAFFFTSGAVTVYPAALRGDTSSGSESSRLRLRNAANSQERMPTTKV